MHDLDRIQAELESATAADLDDAPLLAELDMEEDLSLPSEILEPNPQL